MTTPERRDDAEMRQLLAQVAQRDKAAFRALYHALYPLLLRYLYRRFISSMMLRN
jgi:DNA-directed RNA polymerase specialized sigma24 family protein